ncbi:hypothetical protein C8R44DRAFT_887031 [Mycena epipterygia]|nr:hypothetical protein C8R44DRAFT_887031 [Mycena epipterygia]
MELLGNAVNAATRNSPGIVTPVVLRTDQLDVRGGKLKISPDPWDMATNSLSSVARRGDPDRICIFCMYRPIFSSQAVKLKGGKPVIYLFGPQRRGRSRTPHINPRLGSRCGLSGSRPPGWNPHGAHHRARCGVFILEAPTNHDVPMTPPGFPLLNSVEPSVAQSESFSTTTCDLTSADSVLLPVNTITPYLDEALRKLDLHTEASMSFVTYWLPSFLNHTHVALRFVSQAKYERTARLEITSAPDVVARVFMIFKGVAELDVAAGEWNKEAGDPARWRDVVGVDVGRAGDPGLFRVLK